jgi:hypothetical protein
MRDHCRLHSWPLTEDEAEILADIPEGEFWPWPGPTSIVVKFRNDMEVTLKRDGKTKQFNCPCGFWSWSTLGGMLVHILSHGWSAQKAKLKRTRDMLPPDEVAESSAAAAKREKFSKE